MAYCVVVNIKVYNSMCLLLLPLEVLLKSSSVCTTALLSSHSKWRTGVLYLHKWTNQDALSLLLSYSSTV
jgi:hypothetical protein